MNFPVSKPPSICWARFNIWAVHDLTRRKPACYDKDMLDNGRQAVLHQALAQFVQVTQKGIGLKLF